MAIAKKTSAKTAKFYAPMKKGALHDIPVSYRTTVTQGTSRTYKYSGTVIILRTSNTDWSLQSPSHIDTPPINQTAIALLRSWRNEDAEQQRQDWEKLKQVIDEDRSPDRKHFS